MSEQNKPTPSAEEPKPADDSRPFADVQPLKERLYDQIKIPVKVLDVIIVLLVLALIVCLMLGVVKGNAL